jgi:hypothetical protein
VTGVEEFGEALDVPGPDLRIGMPERGGARDALDVHLPAGRIDSAEYDHRWAACEQARSQADLFRIFVDLPAPHPELPGMPGRSTRPDEDMPPLAIAICIALLLGLPVAVVLGFVYGAWWSLAVPVGVSVAMLYIEHLVNRAAKRRRNEPLDIPGT